jgi:hypothetical protein
MSSSSSTVTLIDYSERGIAVIGNTKPYTKDLKTAGGTFNNYVKVGDKSMPGWFFSKTKLKDIQKLVDDVNSGKLTAQEPSYESKENNLDLKKAYQALVSRVERLEQELSLRKIEANNVNIPSSTPKLLKFRDEDEDDDDEH